MKLDKDQVATGYLFGELRQEHVERHRLRGRRQQWNEGCERAGHPERHDQSDRHERSGRLRAGVDDYGCERRIQLYRLAARHLRHRRDSARRLRGRHRYRRHAGGTVANDQFTAIALTDLDGTGYNFGERPASVSGRVWRDIDRDGAIDAGEVGIPNVTISLTDTSSGTVVRTTTTDANGNYTFPDLPAATYTITETQPSGFGSTTPDSIANIALAAGSSSSGHNFGESTGSLSGSVFFDRNGNGANDGTDSPIASVTVTLTGTDAQGANVNRTTTTDATGAFTFTDLLAPNGTGYTLTETQPTAYANGQVNVGSRRRHRESGSESGDRHRLDRRSERDGIFVCRVGHGHLGHRLSRLES